MPETSAKIRDIFSTGVIKPSEQTLFPKHDTGHEASKASAASKTEA
jgi:hypothetical protein